MPAESFSGCTIKAYRHESAVLAELAGILKLQNCAAVKDALLALLREKGVRTYYLNLVQLIELDSAGLGLLVGLHMTARKEKIDFHLFAPAPYQMKLLSSTRLTALLSITTASQADAIRERLARPEFSITLPEPPLA